jgi:hypothetical protein
MLSPPVEPALCGAGSMFLVLEDQMSTPYLTSAPLLAVVEFLPLRELVCTAEKIGCISLSIPRNHRNFTDLAL